MKTAIYPMTARDTFNALCAEATLYAARSGDYEPCNLLSYAFMTAEAKASIEPLLARCMERLHASALLELRAYVNSDASEVAKNWLDSQHFFYADLKPRFNVTEWKWMLNGVYCAPEKAMELLGEKAFYAHLDSIARAHGFRYIMELFDARQKASSNF